METALFNNYFAYCPNPSVLRCGFFQRRLKKRGDDWRNGAATANNASFNIRVLDVFG
jgi:hypothetical protein